MPPCTHCFSELDSLEICEAAAHTAQPRCRSLDGAAQMARVYPLPAVPAAHLQLTVELPSLFKPCAATCRGCGCRKSSGRRPAGESSQWNGSTA